MNLTVFAIVLLVPPTFELVDCSIACRRCQERTEENFEVLEVYCAMCRECRSRRNERKLNYRRDPGGQQIIYNVEDFPEDCPTPPPCELDLEDVLPITLSLKDPTTSIMSTSTASTSTTPRRPCPAPQPCKKRRNPSPPSQCYYPCMPMCPCPYSAWYTTPRTQLTLKSLTSGAGVSSTGYLHVFIGVPKDILERAMQ